MALVSVIVPAARDHGITAALLVALKWRGGIKMEDVEVVVVSPTLYIEGAKNIHDDWSGASASVAIGLPHATGRYIAWMSDEAEPGPDCLSNMLDFLAARHAPFLGEFHMGWAEPGRVYGYSAGFGKQYARMGMATRATIDQIGFFDPGFKNFFGDVDLGMRCWKMGGAVETCVNAQLRMTDRWDGLHAQNRVSTRGQDYAYFIKKWGDTYPLLRTGCEDGVWNKTVWVTV